MGLTACSDLLHRPGADAAAASPQTSASARYPVVIDPLIDGMTGGQSAATQAMGACIVALIHERYPQYEVQPFTPGNVAQSPLVLVGNRRDNDSDALDRRVEFKVVGC